MATPGSEPSGDRAEAIEDLQATEDAIARDLDRLRAIEAQKQALDPGAPQVDALSNEAVAVAERILDETRAERALAREVA